VQFLCGKQSICKKYADSEIIFLTGRHTIWCNSSRNKGGIYSNSVPIIITKLAFITHVYLQVMWEVTILVVTDHHGIARSNKRLKSVDLSRPIGLSTLQVKKSESTRDSEEPEPSFGLQCNIDELTLLN